MDIFQFQQEAQETAAQQAQYQDPEHGKQPSVETYDQYDQESAGDDSNYEDIDENEEEEQQMYGNEYQIQDMSTQENLTDNTQYNDYADNVSPGNLIYATLPPQSRLSDNFKRFYQEFERNIDFILKQDYEILPNQRTQTICKAESKRLKQKYENLLNQSKEMCRRFTGPHSVLQIFLEKIVASISQISINLQDYTIKNLQLWSEMQVAVPVSTSRKASSSLLTGHKRSSSADTSLLITKKNKASAGANVTPII